LKLVRLETQRFRNLKDQSIAFDNRVTVLVGDNGHGKTSIIEAVYMLSAARSFRTHSVKELMRWDSSEKQCTVRGIFESQDGTKEIVFEYLNGKRNIFVNGNPIQKASGFFGKFLTIVFTPDELQLVKGSPSVRRKFVDRVISMIDPNYVDELVAYQRALRHRNAVLTSGPVDLENLEPWNQLLIKHGHSIAEKRRDFVEQIREGFQFHYDKIIKLSSSEESVEITYQSNFMSEGKLMSRDELGELFAKSAARDCRYRATTKGIHRDEFPIYINFGGKNKEARSAASQGQSRSAALALKLVATQRIKEVLGEAPIVLLDDVESELDSRRVKALYDVLEELETQVIITATELSSALKKSDAKVGAFQLVNGQVKP
jgi:DNA replication and repair protein RecF